MKDKLGIFGAALALAVLVCSSFPASAQEAVRQGDRLTPVVIFPAYHFTRLRVEVKNQTVAPGCPANWTFEEWFGNVPPSTSEQVCQDKLLTLVYTPDPSKPMPKRFSNQPGVKVEIADYGKTASAPYYEDLYQALEAVGYARNVNIRVAGYDARLTPDIGNFLERSVDLIEKTYRDNGNTPVHLIGHSNGPLYAQYLLTHASQAWKDKYIHGFTPLAGNWPGQGLLYPALFTGLNTVTLSFPSDPANAASSARMLQTHPSSYMSAADPAVFGAQETVVEDLRTGIAYTPADYPRLFQDAGLSLAQELAAYYIGFVKFADPAHFPNVDVYAEKGSGIETWVGLKLDGLGAGQVFDPNVHYPDRVFTRLGDVNQEDITNDSIQVWQGMSCFRFELTDNPGVNHFALPSDPGVLQRLLANLRRPKSVCP
jgi:lecithin-cholesterol acyltransferase